MSKERAIDEKRVGRLFALENKSWATRVKTKQEPVGWIIETEIEGKLREWICTDEKHYMDASDGKDPIPLYTAPPKREPLSVKDIDGLIIKAFYSGLFDFRIFARAIEKAHGITGGGE